MKGDFILPKVGMLIDDADPRNAGRRLRIVEIGYEFVYAVVVRDREENTGKSTVGRESRISLHRLRDCQSGYRPVEETR